MVIIEAEGFGGFEVENGTRLVVALEQNGVDILHRCGGNAKCTTCRVEFLEGEPQKMTVAERDKLIEKGLLGQVRLSCQIACEHDMSLRPVNLFSQSGLSDPGPEPAQEITPSPEWTQAPARAAQE
ncbi:MAG: (2Fe-2S)-binding protein [Chloroflexota bacterium]|nr:(2Fe-2S)-binding protein [Chloroflexota bacterium]